MILLDTNLLVRMTRPLDPQCGVARAAIQVYRARGERLLWSPKTCMSSGPWRLDLRARLLPAAMGWG